MWVCVAFALLLITHSQTQKTLRIYRAMNESETNIVNTFEGCHFLVWPSVYIYTFCVCICIVLFLYSFRWMWFFFLLKEKNYSAQQEHTNILPIWWWWWWCRRSKHRVSYSIIYWQCSDNFYTAASLNNALKYTNITIDLPVEFEMKDMKKTLECDSMCSF